MIIRGRINSSADLGQFGFGEVLTVYVASDSALCVESSFLLTKAKRRLRFCKMFLSGVESEGNLISEV